MANRSIISILTVIFALLVVFTRATNPGIRLRITDKGLQYGKSHRAGLQTFLTTSQCYNQFVPKEPGRTQ